MSIPPAVRLEIILNLLNPTAIDENGQVIKLDPLITKKQALILLEDLIDEEGETKRTGDGTSGQGPDEQSDT